MGVTAATMRIMLMWVRGRCLTRQRGVSQLPDATDREQQAKTRNRQHREGVDFGGKALGPLAAALPEPDACIDEGHGNARLPKRRNRRDSNHSAQGAA